MKQIVNIIRYIVFFLLNFFVMVVFHSYVNFIIFVIMAVIPFLSIYETWLLSHRIQFSIELPVVQVNRGIPFFLYFDFYNPLWCPLVNAYVTLEFANPFYGEKRLMVFNLPVRAGKKTRFPYEVQMDYCGCVSVRAVEIRFEDLLGIFMKKKAVDACGECIIYPNGETGAPDADMIYMNEESEALESRKRGVDFSEVSDIREYIPGDKLQNIHWKISSKRDELMVKERVGMSASSLNILVDLYNDDSMCLEPVLELADGITRSLIMRNIPFTVYYYSVLQDKLCGRYVENENERRQWMETMLYDRCDDRRNYAEEIYMRQYGMEGACLYIGIDDGSDDSGKIRGRRHTAAVLKGGG